ncbi:hypothetical protein J7384_16920 [Endozoicomonas sp. G2_1]|uniref:hypothetical protein n=1 Tax=Endozoicomonas sp. G2_1 TaxID=2821091 RepID=UPI001ADAD324|nr:hypothetical protein [Endozoicomonas sp. G2_1]MBO9492046.1 hypothetical protein [Endozoicomonas sp. G2_1]
MELSTILILLLAIHCFVAFIISLSVLNCPFRFSNEKLGLFLLTWLVPYVGPIISHYRLGKIGSVKGDGSFRGSSTLDIPPDNSGCGGSSGGGD